MALIILLLTLVSGYLPFHRRAKDGQPTKDFPYGEALACGVFLGAGLIHMLGAANTGFTNAGIDYPMAFVLSGCMFLVLLLLEHIGTELKHHANHSNNSIAILSVIMLAIHSLLEGTAVGIGSDLAETVILFVAIIAHKWAASFALSLQINKSTLSLLTKTLLFLLFAIMTPLGVFFGLLVHHFTHNNIALPIFNALAAGTFLYIGTLHGLSRAVLVDRCCNLREFSMVIVGFTLMAIVAIWA
tara:strand:- start:6369 stop:7097 length:729 start_codon:yes stop_codon:yes gene_type:complete